MAENPPLDNMLKPFRIKGLNGSTSADERTAKSVPLSLVTNDGIMKPRTPRSGVVHLSAPQYDQIVTTHPKAALTYMDEDDGEVIAVSLPEHQPVMTTSLYLYLLCL